MHDEKVSMDKAEISKHLAFSLDNIIKTIYKIVADDAMMFSFFRSPGAKELDITLEL